MKCVLEGNCQGIGRGGVWDEVALKRAEKKGGDIKLLLWWPGRTFMLVLLGPYPSTKVTDQEVIYRFHTLPTEAFVIGLTNLVPIFIVRVLLMQVAVIFP